ncbi:MAG: TM2 domain-containing protein [Bacteroidales bacterium]|nr:TM2 domain-containing protein [Bacteroidales bacterium]
MTKKTLALTLAVLLGVASHAQIATLESAPAETAAIAMAEGQSIELPIGTAVAGLEDAETQVKFFLMNYADYFEQGDLVFVKKKLQAMTEDDVIAMSLLDYVNPTVNLIVSIFAGGLGVDRFLIGQTGLGILKFVTAGGLGIWTIIDWFQIQNLTKRHNMEVFNRGLLYLDMAKEQ